MTHATTATGYDLADHQARIRAAWAALQGARAAARNRPSVDTKIAEEAAERRLNDLLERLPHGQEG